MDSYNILNSIYGYIATRPVSSLEDLKREIKEWLLDGYGDLTEAIYGRLSDDYIEMAIAKILRAYEKGDF